MLFTTAMIQSGTCLPRLQRAGNWLSSIWTCWAGDTATSAAADPAQETPTLPPPASKLTGLWRPALVWAAWLAAGAAFYTYHMDLPWAQGTYMAVNVGYSIGWGYPAEPTDMDRLFSVVYVLSGASAVAAVLGMFAQTMIASSKNWYAAALADAQYATATGRRKWWMWLRMHGTTLRILAAWIVWVGALSGFYAWRVDDRASWVESLYFAVSSLSTGGLVAIPADSPDSDYAFVAMMAATGVPLMGLAMGHAASLLVASGDDPEAAQRKICAKVTRTELEMMQRFHLDDGDGEISRAEYILLCCVRLGALPPALVERINHQFTVLDTSRDGALSYAELLAAPPAAPARAAATSAPAAPRPAVARTPSPARARLNKLAPPPSALEAAARAASPTGEQRV